jgi:hypothetical protein
VTLPPALGLRVTGAEHKIISYIFFASAFDCSNELMRYDESMNIYSDGTTGASLLKANKVWDRLSGGPEDGIRAVFNFVCTTKVT